MNSNLTPSELAARLRVQAIKQNARALAEAVHAGLLNQNSRQHYDVATIAEMVEAQVSAALDRAAGPVEDTERLDWLERELGNVGHDSCGWEAGYGRWGFSGLNARDAIDTAMRNQKAEADERAAQKGAGR